MAQQRIAGGPPLRSSATISAHISCAVISGTQPSLVLALDGFAEQRFRLRPGGNSADRMRIDDIARPGNRRRKDRRSPRRRWRFHPTPFARKIQRDAPVRFALQRMNSRTEYWTPGGNDVIVRAVSCCSIIHCIRT